jgi:HEAT repeat protein
MTEVFNRIGGLLSRLQSPDFYEREKAVKELGRLENDEAVAGLILALEDDNLGIRELAAEFLASMRGDTVVKLLIRFLAHQDIGTRNLASEVLVKIGSEAVACLVEGLGSDDSNVRKFICDILGLIRDESAVGPVSERLWDENNNVVCSAAEALGEIGSPVAVDSLVAVLRENEDACLPAIEALGKIGDASTLETLHAYLDCNDPMKVYAAVDAIGNIGSADSLECLVPLVHNSNRLVAEAAMLAVVKISQNHSGPLSLDLPLDDFRQFLFDGMRNGDRAITEFTLSRMNTWYGSDMLQGLLDTLDYLDEETLQEVAQLLIQIGPSAAPMITRKITGAPAGLKLKLLDVLKQFADPGSALDLLPLVSHADPEVRQRTAHILGISGCTEACGRLKDLTGDPNGHVRAAAYSALGWLCTPDDVEGIMPGLDDPYPDVREAAMGALIIVGGRPVVEKFAKDLYHEDYERQRLAVMALGWIGEADVVDALLEAVDHPDPTIRRSAINSLARIGHVHNLQPIVIALSDENSAVRKAAVTALLSLRGGEAVNEVRVLLGDNDIWVRYHTLTSIGELRDARFADYVLPFLEDDQDIIKIAAVKALASMGNRDAVPILNELQHGRNMDLAAAAQRALEQIGE